MTREEAKRILYVFRAVILVDASHIEAFEMAIKALDQEAEAVQFAKWVAREIFDDMWEYNKESFAEIACRKLAMLGIVRGNGDKWELVEPQERSDKE